MAIALSELVKSVKKLEDIQNVQKLMDILDTGEVEIYCVQKNGYLLNSYGDEIDYQDEYRDYFDTVAVFSNKVFADVWINKYGGEAVSMNLKDLYKYISPKDSIILDYQCDLLADDGDAIDELVWARGKEHKKLEGQASHGDDRKLTITDIFYTESIDNREVPKVGQTVSFFQKGDNEPSLGYVLDVFNGFVNIKKWDGKRYLENYYYYYDYSIGLEYEETFYKYVPLDACNVLPDIELSEEEIRKIVRFEDGNAWLRAPYANFVSQEKIPYGFMDFVITLQKMKQRCPGEYTCWLELACKFVSDIPEGVLKVLRKEPERWKLTEPNNNYWGIVADKDGRLWRDVLNNAILEIYELCGE